MRPTIHIISSAVKANYSYEFIDRYTSLHSYNNFEQNSLFMFNTKFEIF